MNETINESSTYKLTDLTTAPYFNDSTTIKAGAAGQTLGVTNGTTGWITAGSPYTTLTVPTITSSGIYSIPQEQSKMKKTYYADYTLYLYDLSTADGKKPSRRVGKFDGEIEIESTQNVEKSVLLKHAVDIAKIPNAESLTSVVKVHNSYHLEYVQEK